MKHSSHANKPSRKSSQIWIRLIRVLIYLFSITTLTTGLSLFKTAQLSSAFADGSASIKTQFGQVLFLAGLILFLGNLIWGILRWFLRWAREDWSIWRVFGRLIGGGIWRLAVTTPLILVSAVLIAPLLSRILTSNLQSKVTPISFSEKHERLEYISQNLKNLDFNQIKNELAGLMFSNVDFGIDASSNLSARQSLFFDNASAYSPTVTILNKANLSKSGNFVVFYTDTGDDKISDQKARELSDMLETVVAGYKNNLDFDYKYNKITNNTSSILKMQKVLEKSGIDQNILDSAMPVYIVNPYKDGSSILASYAGKKFKKLGTSIILELASLFGEESAKLYSTAPSFPFVNILPENINSSSLPITVAHELGHHYSEIYNEAAGYSGFGSEEDFLDETVANWMAINVLLSQPQDNVVNSNHYNQVYLAYSVEDTINQASTAYKFGGYPALAFLQNYYENVPNSKKIIMDATYYGDALNYLAKHAGVGNFRKTMLSLAEKNLTGNYDGKLINLVDPKGSAMDCADICTKNLSINPASTKYLYLSTSEYQDVTVKFIGEADKVEASLLGKTADGKWKILQSRLTDMEFTINQESTKDFSVLSIATTNYQVIDQGKYTVKITKTKIKDLLADSGEFNFSKYKFSNFLSESGAGCYTVDTDAVFDNFINLVSLSTDFIGELNKLDENLNSDTISSINKENQKKSDEVKSNLTEAKYKLSSHKITICGNYFKKGNRFHIIKSRLQSALIGTINITDFSDKDDRFSTFFGFDLFSRTGKIHLLMQSEGEIGLLSINIQSR